MQEFSKYISIRKVKYYYMYLLEEQPVFQVESFYWDLQVPVDKTDDARVHRTSFASRWEYSTKNVNNSGYGHKLKYYFYKNVICIFFEIK